MMTRVSSEKRYVKCSTNGIITAQKIIAVTCTTPLVKLFGNDQVTWVKTMTYGQSSP